MKALLIYEVVAWTMCATVGIPTAIEAISLPVIPELRWLAILMAPALALVAIGLRNERRKLQPPK